MQVSFGERKIATARSLKFLGPTVETILTWKHQISELTTRLNKACCAIRSIKPCVLLDVLRREVHTFLMPIHVYLMELCFGGTLQIVKKYLKFRKE